VIEQQEYLEAIADSLHTSYRSEIARLKMQLVLYRKVLLDNGIEPPDREGEDLLDMVRECGTVVSTASAFVQHLGTAKELLYGWPQA